MAFKLYSSESCVTTTVSGTLDASKISSIGLWLLREPTGGMIEVPDVEFLPQSNVIPASATTWDYLTSTLGISPSELVYDGNYWQSWYWQPGEEEEPGFDLYAFKGYTFREDPLEWYDPPDIGVYTIKVRVLTSSGTETLQHVWCDEQYWSEEFGWIWPTPNPPGGISYSVETKVYVRPECELGQYPGLSSYPHCSETNCNKIWCPYRNSRSACWSPDPMARVTWAAGATSPSISVTFGSKNGNYTPDSFSLLRFGQVGITSIDGLFANSEFVATFSRTGLGAVDFGTHNYVDESELIVVGLDGAQVSITPTEASGVSFPAIWHFVAAYDVDYTGAVKYVDGKAISTSLNIPEVEPVWDSGGSEWIWPDDRSSTLPSTGGSFEYGGWWQVQGIAGCDGDYMIGEAVAEYKHVCVEEDSYGDFRRWHGPMTVISPSAIYQPEYPTPSGETNCEYYDSRVLFKDSSAALSLGDALTVEVTSRSREAVEWLYSARSLWTLSDSADFTFADEGGALKATCNDASGWMSIAYTDCDVSGAPTHWLGVRFIDVDIDSTTNDPFTIEIAGRSYTVSADKQRVDLLACSGAAPSEPTQSLLPTFKPYQKEDGVPDPPTVTDIPNDCGIYLPGTIKLSGMKSGESYTLNGITLVMVANPKVLILPEANWTGYEPDCERDESSDPAAFCAAGDDYDTELEMNVEENYCQRIGLVLCDGIIAAEIIGVLHRKTWNQTYSCWDRTVLLPTVEPELCVFPFTETPFFEITGTTIPTTAWGWWDPEDLGALQVPVAHLDPGLHTIVSPSTTVGLNAHLRLTYYDLPANWPDITITHEKYYGALGLTRVANSTRSYSARPLALTTGCDGNYSADTDSAGTYLTWTTTTDTKTLRQWNSGYTLHEWTAELTDEADNSGAWEARNRMLSFLLLKSSYDPSADGPLLYDGTDNWLHYTTDGYLEHL